MPIRWQSSFDDWTTLDSSQVRVLTTLEERATLTDLAECKRKLAEALARIEGPGAIAGGDDSHALAPSIASFAAGDRPREASLGAVFLRYSELRGRLALANMRLVAHVAKR